MSTFDFYEIRIHWVVVLSPTNLRPWSGSNRPRRRMPSLQSQESTPLSLQSQRPLYALMSVRPLSAVLAFEPPQFYSSFRSVFRSPRLSCRPRPPPSTPALLRPRSRPPLPLRRLQGLASPRAWRASPARGSGAPGPRRDAPKGTGGGPRRQGRAPELVRRRGSGPLAERSQAGRRRRARAGEEGATTVQGPAGSRPARRGGGGGGPGAGDPGGRGL